MHIIFFNAEYAENYAEGAEEFGFPDIFCVLCVSSALSALEKVLNLHHTSEEEG